jgi:hypothetical protein
MLAVTSEMPEKTGAVVWWFPALGCRQGEVGWMAASVPRCWANQLSLVYVQDRFLTE